MPSVCSHNLHLEMFCNHLFSVLWKCWLDRIQTTQFIVAGVATKCCRCILCLQPRVGYSNVVHNQLWWRKPEHHRSRKNDSAMSRQTFYQTIPQQRGGVFWFLGVGVGGRIFFPPQKWLATSERRGSPTYKARSFVLRPSKMIIEAGLRSLRQSGIECLVFALN
jgi:hypothetical protein